MLAPQAKLFIVKGAGHSDIHKFEAYVQGFDAMLAGL